VGVVSLIAAVAPLTCCPDAKVEKAARQSAGSHAHRKPGILSRVDELDSPSVTKIESFVED
jgi:hypothetical protein